MTGLMRPPFHRDLSRPTDPVSRTRSHDGSPYLQVFMHCSTSIWRQTLVQTNALTDQSGAFVPSPFEERHLDPGNGALDRGEPGRTGVLAHALAQIDVTRP